MTPTTTELVSLFPVTEIDVDMNNSSIFCNSTSNRTGNDPANLLAVFKDPFEAVIAILHLLLCVIIFTGNTITLSAMTFDKVLQRNIQNKYIMSLAAADQVIGVNLAQLLAKNYFERETWISCQPHLALIYMSSAVGMLNMLSIAVDRYLYIVHPFVHMRHVTARKISILLGAQWLLAAMYGIIPIYVFDADKSKGCNPFLALQRRFVAFSHPIFFFVDCFGIGITYGLIAKVARQHSNRKNKRAQQINATIANNTKVVDNAKPTNEILVMFNSRPTELDILSKTGIHDEALTSEHAAKEDVQQAEFLAAGFATSSSETNEEYTKGINSTNGNEHYWESKDNLDDIDKNVPQGNDIGSFTDGSSGPKNGLDRGIRIAANVTDKYSDVLDKENNQSEDDFQKNTGLALDKNIKAASNFKEGTRRNSAESLTRISCAISNEQEMSRTGKGIVREAFQESNENRSKATGIITSADGHTNEQREKVAVVEETKESHCQQEQISPWNLASLRWMKQMIVVFGLFFICWTPSMVCIFMSAAYEPNHKVVYVLSMFGMSNSAVNFFVYALYNKTYKAVIKRMLCVFCKRISERRRLVHAK